jgi:preprotein translocase subunit YajC
MDFLIILLFGFGVMWLLIVLPQRRRQRAHEELVGNLRPGDYVLTAGGLYGTVLDVGDDDLGLEVSPDIEVRVAKRAVTTVVPPDQIEDVEVEDEPEGEPIEEERG